MVVAGAANAALLQVVAEEYVGDGWVANGYEGLVTYRIYAEFSGEAGDGVVAVFGNADSPLVWESASGSFFNAAILNSLTAPQDATPAIWENQWDTYVTVGTDTADGDQTSLSPGFGAEVNDLTGNFMTMNAAYFITPDQMQGMPDADGRVLIGQLTLNEGDMFIFGGGNTGSQVGIQDYNGEQYFNVPIIPGPGALALLGLAGLAGTRRRR
jgi:uncharacterized protein (TIGR03382 family)